ncbi:FMN reductase (NADH) RutF (plasmid) [Duffyella gerundensis]|uniref:FMN reductase (NADH) RutF n=2 Tax=Duffyella gerundensis TaxID=1619313 RepID=A0A0U5LA22_9GAMM|nr:FMN reductase (NADH) RutF [Duffyella gerundensis]
MSDTTLLAVEETQVVSTIFSDTDDQGRQTFKDAMANLGSAVNIVTTLSEESATGFTATAVCSVTDSPPSLLVCLNHSASVFAAFADAEHLCVNTLAADQEALSGIFGGKLAQQDRFAAVEWDTFITGSPLLSASAVAFDCKIQSRVTVGTHDIMICEIVGIKRQQLASNLVWFNRRYHHLR